MRYQYLSLAYRLRYGVWFDDSKWYYHLVNEKTFRGPFHTNTWGEFLFHTNRILQPNEVCDCRRISNDDKSWPMAALENRYFYDPILNNSLVFINAMGHQIPVRGRLMPNETRTQHKDWHLSALQDFSSNATWEYADWADVVRHQIQHFVPQPRHIIMNAGHWPHKFGWSKQQTPNEPRKLSQESESLLEVIKEYPQYQFTWKSTTYTRERKNGNIENDHAMCDRFPNCMNMSFTRQVQRGLYWDWVHFSEPVYRATNEAMLDLFGYLPNDYTRMNLSEILSFTSM